MIFKIFIALTVLQLAFANLQEDEYLHGIELQQRAPIRGHLATLPEEALPLSDRIHLSVNTGTPGVWYAGVGAPYVYPEHINYYTASDSSGQYPSAASSTTGYVYVSSDYGANWSPKGPGTKAYTSIASDASGNRLAVTVNNQGVYLSSNRGSTWTLAPIASASSYTWNKVISDHSGQYLITFGSNTASVYYSQDFGATWSTTPNPCNYIIESGAMSHDGQYQYANKRDSTCTLRSSNYGATWTQMTELTWARVVACNGNGQRLTAIVNNEKYIFGSTDYGNTWIHFNHPTGSWVTFSSIAMDTTGLNIVVGGHHLKAVIASADGGTTWTYITPVGASFDVYPHRLVADASARYLLIAHKLMSTMNPLVAATATTPPSAKPSFAVTAAPSNRPTTTPSRMPSAAPSRVPSANPSAVPSAGPSATPSAAPSAVPSTDPSAVPSAGPSATPSAAPSAAPSTDPSAAPSTDPSAVPSTDPSAVPSADPSLAPSADPTTDPTVDPSATPSINPSAVPSAAPSTVCLQWVLGAPKESCSATCAAVSRTCSAHHFLDVITAGDFSDMVGSSIDGAGGGAVGAASTYCSQGTNGWPSVGGPVSVSAVLHQSTGDVVQTHCTYPTSTSGVTLGCEDALTAFPSRRFCPCVRDSCDGAWHLGYTGESCTATCSQAGGVCQNSATAAITTSAAFGAMVSTATSLDTGTAVGSAFTFCTATNAPAFGTAPAAVTVSLPLGQIETFCAHPTAATESTCNTEFTYPPAQRFCYCQVGGRRLQEQIQAMQPAAPLKQQKLRTRKV